jgi:Endosomal/lysosomal potassium channel TMEM175
VFAIAMTLLVVEVGVPEAAGDATDDPGALLDLLQDKVPLVVAFFIGCFVIGSYWVAHHRFVTRLAAVDRGFLGLTVVYLAFVALLPFPTGVLGEFGSNPGLGGRLRAQHDRGQRHGGGAVPPRQAAGPAPGGVARGRLPVDDAGVAVAGGDVRAVGAGRLRQCPAGGVLWFLAIPLGRLLDRRRPAGADRYLA